jgi:hypothetical protein
MTATTTTMGSAPNLDGILLLEGPFARVPHDELRRQLRFQQRLVERDLTFCSTTLASSSLRVKEESGNTSMTEVGQSSTVGESSFAQDVSFMSEATRADDSVMTVAEEELEMDGPKAKGSDLERSLDLMLGRLRGLKRKVSK